MSQNGTTNWQVQSNYGCLSGKQNSPRTARAKKGVGVLWAGGVYWTLMTGIGSFFSLETAALLFPLGMGVVFPLAVLLFFPLSTRRWSPRIIRSRRSAGDHDEPISLRASTDPD